MSAWKHCPVPSEEAVTVREWLGVGDRGSPIKAGGTGPLVTIGKDRQTAVSDWSTEKRGAEQHNPRAARAAAGTGRDAECMGTSPPPPPGLEPHSPTYLWNLGARETEGSWRKKTRGGSEWAATAEEPGAWSGLLHLPGRTDSTSSRAHGAHKSCCHLLSEDGTGEHALPYLWTPDARHKGSRKPRAPGTGRGLPQTPETWSHRPAQPLVTLPTPNLRAAGWNNLKPKAFLAFATTSSFSS